MIVDRAKGNIVARKIPYIARYRAEANTLVVKMKKKGTDLEKIQAIKRTGFIDLTGLEGEGMSEDASQCSSSRNWSPQHKKSIIGFNQLHGSLLRQQWWIGKGAETEDKFNKAYPLVTNCIFGFFFEETSVISFNLEGHGF